MALSERKRRRLWQMGYQQRRPSVPEIEFIRVLHSSPCAVILASVECVSGRNGRIASRLVLWSHPNLPHNSSCSNSDGDILSVHSTVIYLRVEVIFQVGPPAVAPLEAQADHKLLGFVLPLFSCSCLQGRDDVPQGAQVGFQELDFFLQLLGAATAAASTS